MDTGGCARQCHQMQWHTNCKILLGLCSFSHEFSEEYKDAVAYWATAHKWVQPVNLSTCHHHTPFRPLRNCHPTWYKIQLLYRLLHEGQEDDESTGYGVATTSGSGEAGPAVLDGASAAASDVPVAGSSNTEGTGAPAQADRSSDYIMYEATV